MHDECVLCLEKINDRYENCLSIVTEPERKRAGLVTCRLWQISIISINNSASLCFVQNILLETRREPSLELDRNWGSLV